MNPTIVIITVLGFVVLLIFLILLVILNSIMYIHQWVHSFEQRWLLWPLFKRGAKGGK